MQKKKVSFETDMQKIKKSGDSFKPEADVFNYGNLSKLRVFKDSHPAVMEDFIKKFDWQHQLYPQNRQLEKHKQDKLKYRLLSFIEQYLLGGNQIAGLKNYRLIKIKSPTR
jgi:hypothetical protein